MLSDTVFERLQKIAVPLVDTPETIIVRLLSFYESKPGTEMNTVIAESPASHSLTQSRIVLDGTLQREPRQRGTVVRLDDKMIKAESVSDLYYKALCYLGQKGVLARLDGKLPIATSRKRYLMAKTPTHPGGAEFVVPVEYKGYFMEAHKDYKNGVSHLRKILKLCGVTLTYVE